MEDFKIADAQFPPGPDKNMFMDGHGETGIPGQIHREIQPAPQFEGMDNDGYLSAVPGERDISLGTGCAVYEEIFVKSLKTGNNEIYKAKRQVDARGQPID